MSDQASATSLSSYCRSTLKARMTVAFRASGSGVSKPPSAKLTRASGANGVLPARTASSCSVALRTRSGAISSPITSTSARTRASRCCNSSAVTPLAP
jgi:hypothetical protein